MKKTASLRLTLNRETLRTLDASDLAAAPGGVITAVTCPTRCGGSCSATTQTC
jgi:hypothetical protein